MFRSIPASASATFFFITDQRATDRTTHDLAWVTSTHGGVTWVFRARKPKPPPRGVSGA